MHAIWKSYMGYKSHLFTCASWHGKYKLGTHEPAKRLHARTLGSLHPLRKSVHQHDGGFVAASGARWFPFPVENLRWESLHSQTLARKPEDLCDFVDMAIEESTIYMLFIWSAVPYCQNAYCSGSASDWLDEKKVDGTWLSVLLTSNVGWSYICMLENPLTKNGLLWLKCHSKVLRRIPCSFRTGCVQK